MLDHVILTVSDIERSLAFYEAALKPLNIKFFLPYTGEGDHPHLWGFGDGDTTLNIECPWRLLLDGKIAFGADDDGQQFGLEVPLDGVKELEKLLSTSPVILIKIRPGCSDLSLSFQNGVCLEAFSGSSGYEGWACSGEGGVAVAQGGGNLAGWHSSS